MDLGGALVADAESAMLVQPRDGAFDDPARRAQAAAVHFFAGATILGDDRLDVADPHRHAVAMRAIAAVGLDGLGPSARGPALAAHRRDGVDHARQLRDVGHVGGRDPRGQGRALGVRDDLVFGAGFSAVGGIGPRQLAPPTARTLPLSITARDQSMALAAWSRASSSSCSFCQTPAACQSRNLRQQVMPQHPNCAGRYSHGMPVRRTKRMPSRQARLSRGLRPGWRFRRGLTGMRGSISVHSSSSSSGLAMGVPPCTTWPRAIRVPLC